MTIQLKEILKGSTFFKSYQLFSLWEKALGEDVVRNTSPIKYQGGTLTVATSSAAWANQLRLLREKLRKKLNQHLEAEKIKEIKFIVDSKFTEHREKRGRAASRPIDVAVDDNESVEQKLERIFSKKDKRRKHTEETFAQAMLWQGEQEKKERLMGLLRKIPWITFQEAIVEIGAVEQEGFNRIKRRMRTSFNDELWRAAKESSRNQLKDVSKLKNLLYDYVMIKSGKKPAELNLRLIQQSVSAKLWALIKEKVKG